MGRASPTLAGFVALVGGWGGVGSWIGTVCCVVGGGDEWISGGLKGGVASGGVG